MLPARIFPSPRFSLSAVLWLCAACGGVDAGESPYAGTERAQGPGAAYSFRYLSPPWAGVSAVPGIYAVADLDTALHLDLAHLPQLDTLPVVLRVEAVGGSADGAVQTRAATVSPPVPLSSTRALRTVEGIHGREVSWTDTTSTPPLYWREGYFDGVALGASTFRMQFRGRRPIADDPLIEAMLASFASGSGNR